MAKRKKTKRRAPKKKTQRSEEPDEVEETEEDELEAGGADDDDAVDASFDEDDDEAVAASSDLDEPVSKGKGPRGAGDRPVGPALDAGSPNARVSTGGGLWVMAAVFGLIAVAVVAQYFIG